MRPRASLALTTVALVLLAGCEREGDVAVDEAPVEAPTENDEDSSSSDDADAGEADADGASGDGEMDGYGCQ